MPSADSELMESYLRSEGTDPNLSNEIANTVIDVMHARNGKDQWVDFSVRYAIANELQRRLIIFSRPEEDTYGNLERATEITQTINDLRGVQKSLKDAFHHRELDGGAKAAFDHPLYLACEKKIATLQEALTLLI